MFIHAAVQVVTAIIRRDSDGKLLLVKRSDKASTSELGQHSMPVLCSWRAFKHCLSVLLAAMPSSWMLLVQLAIVAHWLKACAVLPQVGSYQQYWGGVSGGVEGNESLLHRALQEVSSCDPETPSVAATATRGRSQQLQPQYALYV